MYSHCVLCRLKYAAETARRLTVVPPPSMEAAALLRTNTY